MKIQIITLFPEMFDKVINTSMLWKAQEKSLVEFSILDLRQYGLGKRRVVDDTPYGGGDGMLLRPEPVVAAIEQAKSISPESVVILMTPRGETYNQTIARKLARNVQDIILVCPRYEGYDERIVKFVDNTISIGNYILTGGEIPAMVVLDSVVRLIPGVLGGETSAEIESFSDENAQELEYPQYTRPDEFRGSQVPSVLRSGNHAEIAKWRQDNSR